MKGLQKTFTYTQLNKGTRDEVFPLLCPVREKDWLDGWEFEMIYSQSGVAEEDCVFTTPHHGKFVTVWHIVRHDPLEYVIEFVRVTPEENVVKIHIHLEEMDENNTFSHISYQYTALNDEAKKYVKEQLPTDFSQSMEWWEHSLNHYLRTGHKLLRESVNH